MRIISFIALATAATAYAATSSSGLFTEIVAPSGKTFGLITGDGSPSRQLNRYDAVTACAALGGTLAALVSDADFDFLADVTRSGVATPAWVGPFNGNDMDGACVAFYPGGAIAVPRSAPASSSACDNLLDVLCEF